MTACTIEGCGAKMLAKGLCSTHYHRVKRGRPVGGTTAARVLDPAPVLALLDGVTNGSAAAMLGVNPSDISRWRSRGQRLSFPVADRCAVRLGRHPVELWGDDWWTA